MPAETTNAKVNSKVVGSGEVWGDDDLAAGPKGMTPDVRTMWMLVATTTLLFGFLGVWAGSRKRREIGRAHV